MQADREAREYPLEFSLVFHVIGLYSYQVCTYTTVALWKVYKIVLYVQPLCFILEGWCALIWITACHVTIR